LNPPDGWDDLTDEIVERLLAQPESKIVKRIKERKVMDRDQIVNQSFSSLLGEAGATNVVTNNREDIFDAINRERQYQESIWGKDDPKDPGNKTEDDWVSAMPTFANPTGHSGKECLKLLRWQ
jgi:hypothetical protein